MVFQQIINEKNIFQILKHATNPDPIEVADVLEKAKELKGLSLNDVAILSNVTDNVLLEQMFDIARKIKESIYGKRLVLFAPLYISNLCVNECTYCAFRAKNKALARRSLTRDEIAQEVNILIQQGHKRILLVSGESYPQEGFQYVLDSIETIYNTKSGSGEIRRVNVNIAPLTLDEFKLLKAAKIGTYQLFQETYHFQTYNNVHLAGKKKSYNWRITALNRAMKAQIDDVGIGVLFGLYDWRFEILAVMQHILYLENEFGVGPHTISVPRLEPATGSDIASRPPYPVNDVDFKKIIAILRLAVPYTGIILSTRETAQTRREAFELGVSQISVGSRTNPGGYTEGEKVHASQFSLNDHRPLDEVIADIAKSGYIPSFCTGCYRLGRTGRDFMSLAKPGAIKHHCDPNALSTFQEYLIYYGSDKTRQAGEKAIEESLKHMDKIDRKRSEKLLEQVRAGKQDVFC